MSTYFNGANSNTYSSYYGPGGSVTIAEGVGIGNITASAGISMAGEGVVVNLGSVAGGEYGIVLSDGGTITNGSATDVFAQINGGDDYKSDGILISGDGVINNFGQIYGIYTAIDILSLAHISNGGSGDYAAFIGGEHYGIVTRDGGTILNYGSITAFDGQTPEPVYGVGIANLYNELYLRNGNVDDKAIVYGEEQGVYSPHAQIYNYGEIKGGSEGIDFGFSGTIHNYGTIKGGDIGIIVDSASIQSSGTIIGDDGIYSSYGSVSIKNSGIIISDSSNSELRTGYGIKLGTNSGNKTGLDHIYNEKGAIIQGYVASIYSGRNIITTLFNYGTIENFNDHSIYAIELDNPHDLLVVESGSTIVGAVANSGTLELGAGGGPGTYSGRFFPSKSFVQSGADWTLSERVTLYNASVLVDYGTLNVGQEIKVASTLDILGTLVDTGTITAVYGGVVTNDGLLEITQGGVLDIAGTLTGDGMTVFQVPGILTGDGTIELSDDATLDIFGLANGGVVDFADSTGFLSLADPLGLGVRIDGFQQGDIIDLPAVSDTGTASLSYSGGVLSVLENGTLAAELSLANVPEGTVFGLQGDHHGGTEVVIWSVPNVLPAAQLGTLENGIIALGRDVAATQSVTDPSLNVFTPKSLLNPSGGPVKGDINIADGRPTAIGETITLGPKAQGIVLTGQHRAAEIVGHAANAYAATELLVGNNGNDTILGGGGSGTIIAGSGQNQIETGSGNMLVSSSGSDQIETGSGDDTVYAGGVAWVTAQGNATVHGGAGFTTFTDAGTATSADKVKGGSGTTIMNSGIGQDTFVGGTGTSFMNDTGPGRVALVFNKGVGGTDIVTGFDPSNGDYIRTTAASNGWADFQNNISVIGGSSFVNLADGTKIEFVGFTSLSAADFHG